MFTFPELRIDDTFLVRKCPPVSARKRFTLEKILKSPETERDEMHARMAAEAEAKHALEQSSSQSTQPTPHAS